MGPQSAEDLGKFGRPAFGFLKEAIDEGADEVLQLLATCGGDCFDAIPSVFGNSNERNGMFAHY